MLGQNRVALSDVEMQTKYMDARKEMEAGKLDKGILILEALYRENRNNASISYELAKAYAVKKDFSSVEKYGDNAIKNAPQNEWMLEFYGEYMLENNRPETALRLFDQLILLKPENGLYYDHKVDALMKLNRGDDAIATYNALELKIGPSPDLYLNKFDILDNLNRVDAALAELNKLIAYYPLDKKYLKIKAGFLKKNGKEKDAKDLYAQVLKLDENDVEANVAMITNDLGSDKSDAYLRSLLPIISNQSVPLDSKIKEILPYIENLSVGKDTALKEALMEVGNKLILTHPTEAKAHALYGDILIHSGEISMAAIQYEKTLEIDDKKYAVWEQLMFALYELNQFDNLKKYATEAIDYFPNEAVSYFFASMAEIESRNAKSALSLAEEGVKIAAIHSKKASLLYTALSSAKLALGDVVNAKDAAEKAVQLSEGKNSFAFESLGDIAKYSKDLNAAKEAWAKSKVLGNNSRRLQAKIEGESN